MKNTYKTKKGWKWWIYHDEQKYYVSDEKTYKTETEANFAREKAIAAVGWRTR